MDILNKVSSKISKQFSTLKTDAVPSRRKVSAEAPTSANDSFSQASDTQDDVPPVRPERRKAKKNVPMDENVIFNGVKTEPPPMSTHANGSVINIINSNGVHWGPEITYNINTPNSPSKSDTEENTEPVIVKTQSIANALESRDMVEHDHLDIVSKKLGAGWRAFVRNLGYEEGMIDIFYESNHRSGISEVIYQIFLDWTRIEKRTLGELCTELWKEGKQSLVRDLALLSKTSSKNISDSE